MNFLESFLSFGDLDEGRFTGTEFFEENKTVSEGGNTSSGFSDPLSMGGGVSFSFSGSLVHSSVGINDQLFISSDSFFEHSFSWVEYEIKHMSGDSNVLFSFSNSGSDGSFPFVVLSFFDVKIELFDFSLESDVSVEVLESLEEISNW